MENDAELMAAVGAARGGLEEYRRALDAEFEAPSTP